MTALTRRLPVVDDDPLGLATLPPGEPVSRGDRVLVTLASGVEVIGKAVEYIADAGLVRLTIGPSLAVHVYPVGQVRRCRA